MPPHDLRADALAIHAAGVAAAEPEAAVAAAARADPPPAGPVWILAVGKAADGMARGAVSAARELGAQVAGGIVVSHLDVPGPPAPQISQGNLDRLDHAVGDHPLPGDRSLAAAQALEASCRRIGAHHTVLVLLSGGASSLLAAPVDGLGLDDFRVLHELVGAAGLPIDRLNAVRKRFARLGAGRLRLAIPSPDVRVYCVSDVPGDDPRDIGSGPCEPDPVTAPDVRRILVEAGIWSRVPPGARRLLEETEAGARPETPKPGDPRLIGPPSRVVASNATARRAAAAEARARGYEVEAAGEQLTGPAAEAGARLAAALSARAARPGPAALIWGGETTVTLDPGAGEGGRCQELALAAALGLERAATTRSARAATVLLAAGTDGRDGPTDAAGALVDADTAGAIRRAGRDPEDALRRHDAYPALAAAAALLRTGPTGTNVMDLVIGLVGRPV